MHFERATIMKEDSFADTVKEFAPFLLILIIFAFALTDIITIYNVGGIQWDFAAEVLWAKSLLSPAFYHALFSGNLANAIDYGGSFYFESIRPPLIGILMLPFLALGGSNFVPLYLTFGLLLLLFAVLYISRALETDPLLLTLLFFTPYVIFYFFMLTGTEIIAMSFLLLFMGLVLKKRWESGVMIAIAGFAKYNSLIFLPLLLLLPGGARKKAFVSFALTLLPWLLINTIIWHNPVYSYTLSTQSFVKDKAGIFNTAVITESLKLILPDLVPALLIAIALLLFYVWQRHYGRRHVTKHALTRFPSYKYTVVLAILLIGWIGWLLGSAAGSLNDSPREGYVIYIGIALLSGLLITDLSKRIRMPGRISLKTYATALLFIVTLAMLISAFNSVYNNFPFSSYGSTDPIYQTLRSTLAADGLSNCSVISNNWVYLIYAGIEAHYPYSYNYTEQHYPIVYFTDLGANNSAVNFNNVTTRLNYTDFYIAFPRNWTCVSSNP